MKRFNIRQRLARLRVSKRYAAALAAAVVLLAAAMPGSVSDAAANPDKPKSETVYAILGNDGNYMGSTVVNCFEMSGEIVDYGQYTSVVNMSGPGAAVIEGEKITWPADVTAGEQPFYYQGETQKKLPLSIGIAYWLDGEAVQPEDILGKTGELKIEFHIVNETGTGEMDEAVDREVMTPFAAQVSLSLPNTMYTVTDKPENATLLLAGSTYTLSYASFPLPEDTFSITLDGTDMELEPINIVLVPKAPPGLDAYGDFVDVDGMEQGADDMIEGTEDMREGTDTLLDALYDMRDGVDALRDGLNDLSDGADTLDGGAAELYMKAKALKSAAADFSAGLAAFAQQFAVYDDGMAGLAAGVSDLADNLSDLNQGATGVYTGVSGISSGLDGVSESNAGLYALAQAVAAAHPEDTNAAALATGLSGQQTAIDTMAGQAAGLKTAAGDVSNGMQTFYTGFAGDFTDSVTELRTGSTALFATARQLSGGAADLSAGCAALCTAIGKLKSGADDLAVGAGEAARQVPALADGIDEMIDGVIKLGDGIDTLSDDGLKELKSKFDGLNGYLDKLSQKANGYGSFMDVRNADKCRVQFILKTSGIKKDSTKNR